MMARTFSRRDWLRASGGLALSLSPLALPRAWGRAQGKTKRILFFTKSSGFQHSVVTRDGDKLAHAERILAEIGLDRGYEIVPSKDGRLFDPDKIGQWDGFAFYTTGDLTQPGGHNDGQPMTPEGKQALLDAVAGGKAFVGFHCATDSFHSKGDAVDPYIRMIGGEFLSHGAQQAPRLVTTDLKFPGADAFGAEFELMDEWYTQKNINDDLHVIMYNDTATLKGPMYERPSFPMTWARMEGKGRVFYTGMGHREDVWENPKFQAVVLGGLDWATGKVDADVTPNITKVTPGFAKLSNG